MSISPAIWPRASPSNRNGLPYVESNRAAAHRAAFRVHRYAGDHAAAVDSRAADAACFESSGDHGALAPTPAPSSVGSTAEAVQDGESGLLAASGNPRLRADAVCRLLDAPLSPIAWDKRLAARAQSVFSVTQMVMNTSLL